MNTAFQILAKIAITLGFSVSAYALGFFWAIVYVLMAGPLMYALGYDKEFIADLAQVMGHCSGAALASIAGSSLAYCADDLIHELTQASAVRRPVRVIPSALKKTITSDSNNLSFGSNPSPFSTGRPSRNKTVRFKLSPGGC